MFWQFLVSPESWVTQLSHILMITGAGLVTIFHKHDGSIEYREAPHCSTRMVFGIKMLEARALTGAEDGVIHVFQRNSVNQWRMVGLLSGHEGVTHIDGDESWVCSGWYIWYKFWYFKPAGHSAVSSFSERADLNVRLLTQELGKAFRSGIFRSWPWLRQARKCLWKCGCFPTLSPLFTLLEGRTGEVSRCST